MPAGNVARHAGFPQGPAPSGLGRQRLGGQFLAGAAPDAAAAVILLQRLAQRVGSGGLQFRVHRRADRQPAAEKLVLAEFARQLAADFIGEVIARRHLAVGRGEIAVLHAAQRQLGLGLIGGLVDESVLPHLAQDIVAPLGHPFLGADGVIAARRLRHGGQHRGLVRFQFRQRLVEIGLRRRRHAKAVLAQKDLVQVKFQNLVLAQRAFQPRGQDHLFHLALDAAVAGQQEVLHHLLGDGRGAAHAGPARSHRLVCRADDAAHVIAGMAEEVLVLGADEGLLDLVGDFLDRHEDAAFLREFVDQHPFAGINAADRLGRVLRQRLMARQVARIHPEDRTDRQRDEKSGGNEPGKDRTEKGKNGPNQMQHAFCCVAPSIAAPVACVKTTS